MYLNRLFGSLFFTVVFFSVSAQGYLKANGKYIENNKGAFILKGMGLGGWMLQEPYMLKLSGSAVAQYDIRNKIATLVGEEKTRQFYEAWLNNHCTKADIDTLAAWGFNSVRLPMHYNLFTLPVEQEPVPGKQTWLSKGFQLTDSLLSWCKANKIYLILDLHAAPGGQGNDNAISDRDASKPSLWQSEPNKNKTIALWEKLAARYVNEEWIGGYDLINEPNWGFQNSADKNGCAETGNAPLKELYKTLTTAIRKIDQKHIIFLEGNCWGNNYEGMFPLWDNNMVLSFHKYWNFNSTASIQKFLDYREKYNVPIWLGETGENSNAWFTDVVSLLEKNSIGWAMWPLKKSGLNNLLEVKVNPAAQKIINYWEEKGPKPSADEAFKGLMQWAKDTKAGNNIAHPEVADAMMRQVSSAEPIAYKQNIIKPNAVLFASDYDLGRSGIAYHDSDSAEYWVSTNTRTGWNNGHQYRNNGVDIEVCKDEVSNGYNVGWIEAGEWLQYSVYSPTEASFDLQIRAAAKDSAGMVKILINDAAASEDLVLSQTGESQKWKTSTAKAVKLNKGWNKLRVLAVRGGFNLNYFQFIPAANTAKANL